MTVNYYDRYRTDWKTAYIKLHWPKFKQFNYSYIQNYVGWKYKAFLRFLTQFYWTSPKGNTTRYKSSQSYSRDIPP